MRLRNILYQMQDVGHRWELSGFSSTEAKHENNVIWLFERHQKLCAIIGLGFVPFFSNLGPEVIRKRRPLEETMPLNIMHIILLIVLFAGTLCIIFQRQIVDFLFQFCKLGKLFDKLGTCFLSKQEMALYLGQTDSQS